MPNVFLNYGGGSSTAFDPNSTLKTDSAGNITTSELSVSDTTGLQGLLDGKLPEPLPRAAGNDGRYLKYVHGSTPIWDTPAGGSGGGSSTFTGLSDTPGSYTANQAVRVNAAGNALEFYNQAIGEDNGGVSGAVSLRSTGNSITNPELKVLKAGTNVTLSTPEDPNVVQINSTGGVQIDDSTASASTTFSGTKITTELANSFVGSTVSSGGLSFTTKGGSTQTAFTYGLLPSAASNANKILVNDGSSPLWANYNFFDHTTGTMQLRPPNHQIDLTFAAGRPQIDMVTSASSVNPDLYFKLDRTAATNDNVYRSYGQAKNSNGNFVTYSGVKHRVNSATLGAEYGDIHFDCVVNGTPNTSKFTIGGDNTWDTNTYGVHRVSSSLMFGADADKTQSKAVENPTTSGHVLTAGSGGAWSWSPLLDDSNASTTGTYSSSKIVSDYIPYANLHGSIRTGANEVYNAPYVNTQLASKPEIDDSQHTTSAVWSSSNTRNEIIGRVGSLLSRTYPSPQNVASVVTTSQTSFTANNELVSKGYVDTSISNLIDSAPGALDTLNELAAALGDDANFSTTVTNSIATKLPLAGGALTGNVTTNLANSSFTSTSLVSKNYVDNAVGGVGGATTFTALTDTISSYTNDRFLKTSGSAVVDFELNSKTLAWTFYNALSDLPTASGVHGQIAHVHAEGAIYFAHSSAWVKVANSTVADGTLTGCTLSGADLVFTRKNQSNISVAGVNPPAMSWAVQGGTVSNSGATLQLSQTNGTPSAITGLTPSTVADGCYIGSGVLSAGGLQFTKKDSSTVTHPGVLLPPSTGNTNKILVSDGTSGVWASSTLHPTLGNLALRENTGQHQIDLTFAAGTPQLYLDTSATSQYPQIYTRVQRVGATSDQLLTQTSSARNANNTATIEYTRVENRINSGSQGAEHGEIEFSCAYNGTQNTEMMRIGGNNTWTVNVNGVLRTQLGCMFGADSNRVQTAAVLAPTTAGHVLTATGVGAWAWAAPTGGSSVTGTAAPSAGDGILWGDRRFTMIVEDVHLFQNTGTGVYAQYSRGGLGELINGRRAGSGDGFDYDGTVILYPGGHISFKWLDGNAYILTQLHWMIKPYNSVLSNANMTFRIYGSNDGCEYTLLHTFQPSGMSTSTRATNSTGVAIHNAASGRQWLQTTWTNTSGYRQYIIKHAAFSSQLHHLYSTAYNNPLDAGISMFYEIEWG